MILVHKLLLSLKAFSIKVYIDFLEFNTSVWGGVMNIIHSAPDAVV